MMLRARSIAQASAVKIEISLEELSRELFCF